VFNELDRHFNPLAPALEPLDVEVIYVSEDEMGSPRLGSPDFNARLFAQPLRWR
jgi:hypothetical protein